MRLNMLATFHAILLGVCLLATGCGRESPEGQTHPAQGSDRSSQEAVSVGSSVPLQDLTAVHGTRVALRPPPGFEKSTRFPGFLLEASMASIMVSDIAGPYAECTAGLTKEEFAKRGIVLVERNETTVEGKQGLLLRLKQHPGTVSFDKWLLVLPANDGAETVMVAASYPAHLEEEFSALMKASVLSTKYRDVEHGYLLESVPFELTEAGDLRFARPVANSLTMSESGVFPVTGPGDPMLIATASLADNMEIQDRRAHAVKRLHALPMVVDPGVQSISEIQVDRLSGYEVTARGKHEDDGSDISIYLVMLYEKSAYYVIVGIVGTDKEETYFPVFREVVSSFRLKNAEQ